MTFLKNRVDGDVVVLLHSSMSSKSQWNRLIKQLDPSVKIIALDLYGYGDTPMPVQNAEFSLANEVELVLSTVDQQIGPDVAFHLIGHSYGGATSLRLAFENQHRIKSLALFEPVAFYLLDQDETAYQEVNTIVEKIKREIKQDQRQATRSFIDYWSGAGAFAAMPAETQAALIKQIDKVCLDFQALMNDPLRLHHLHVLQFPVCLIKGKSSPLSSRRVAEKLAQSIQNIQCHEVEGGHMAPITHAAAVNEVLAAFVHHQIGITA